MTATTPIGELIRAREKRRLTQVQLAKLAKSNQATISRVETGAAVPSSKLAVRLARVLDVPLDVVLAGAHANPAAAPKATARRRKSKKRAAKAATSRRKSRKSARPTTGSRAA